MMAVFFYPSNWRGLVPLMVQLSRASMFISSGPKISPCEFTIYSLQELFYFNIDKILTILVG